MKNLFFWLVAGLISLFLPGCSIGKSTAAIPAVTPFSVERYMGTWYEIARLPHHFERDLDNVSATYALREDGRVDVVNRGFRDGKERQVKGIAVFKGSPEVGELEVSFFRPFYGDYRIIALADDYSSAIVTSSTNNYLWILARKPRLPKERLDDYLDRIRVWGFDLGSIEYPRQDATAP